jgi:3-oxoacyl-[acyl-carrier-protein] synthase II
MKIEDIRTLMEDQLKASRALKARIRELEDAPHRPLAVVSTALRLPGGLDTPQAYWDFLLGDTDALSAIPADRTGLRAVHDDRPDRPGRSYVARAGFLTDIDRFDPGFFGISQREAETLDPQQRLLLETSWEAMERAGIAVRRQDRLNAGVFIGIMSSEYLERLSGRQDKTAIDPYYGTGGGHAMAAGRISHTLGLSGPAVAVDTACSSSLVALHLAAQSLRRDECRYALVGGANLILSADLMVSLCQSKALAPDGRSKAFTAAADGYGRGEGAGVLLLMRLEDALSEDRPVLAVLRGTAVGHDGASSGLTVPNGPAQQEVIRAAYRDAGIAPHEVGAVEAHGTGTSLGDPIEVGALDAVLGSGAPGRTAPLAVGSVKSRLGHLEAASGIAGLIKVVLMLRHGRIPAALQAHDGELNPLIPWDRTGIDIPRRARDWPAALPRRIAGISAFGMSGTNAHAVLEAHRPAPPTAPPATGPAAARPELLTLSAKTPESLRHLAAALAEHLDRTPPALLPSLCHTLRTGRTPFEHRAAVTGRTGAELAGRLTAAAAAAAAAPAPASGRTAPRLRVLPDSPLLTGALDALDAAHPGAAPRTGPPRERLAALLRALGLRVREDPEPAPPGAPAQLVLGEQVLPLATGDPAAAPALLLDALAASFTAGADLRADALRPPGARILDDLPTYPFRRRRCWIEEPPPPTATATAPATAPAVPLAAPPAPEPGAHTQGISDFLLAELTQVLRAEDPVPLDGTFLEVGGDSFTAMQITMSLEERYGVEVPLEEFSEEVPLATLFERLAGHVRAAGAHPGLAQERTA